MKKSLLIICLIINFCLSSCKNNQTISNQQLVSTFDIYSVEENWERSLKIAKNWDNEAYLDYIRIDVSLPNGNRGIENDINFHFKTPNKDYESIDVNCNKFQCIKRIFTNEQGYPIRHSDPITWLDDYLDSEEILIHSLDHFDRRVLYRQNITLEIVFNQYKSFKDFPVWAVFYYDYTNSEEISLYLHPITGELLSKKSYRP